MEQPAEILGRGLGDAVDILRHRRDAFVDPGRRRARRGLQRVAEGAGCRGHHEGADAHARRRLEEDERPHDVRLDERRSRMRRDMGLVQRRGVEDRVGAVDAAGDASAVGDRADLAGERPGNDVETHRRAARRAKRAHQRLAEMPRTAGDENGHSCADRSKFPPPFRSERSAHQRDRRMLFGSGAVRRASGPADD